MSKNTTDTNQASEGYTNFMELILEARSKVIEVGGRPDTLKVSKQAIEDVKLFGMNIEVVESEWLPDGVKFMVFEEGAIHPTVMSRTRNKSDGRAMTDTNQSNKEKPL